MVHATCACSYQAPTMKPHPMNLAKTVLILKFKLNSTSGVHTIVQYGGAKKRKPGESGVSADTMWLHE